MKKWLLAILFLTRVAYGADTLRVISAGPVGEVASSAEANEVHVVFSEPMVVVGRIPATVTAPFFHIDPSVRGGLRWSGTTTLIFTPDPPLPFARKFDVTIDATAKSVAGNTLDHPYSYSFTTPTIRLLRTQWYRKPGGAVVVGLRFNQPVDANVVVQHLRLSTVTHAFAPPAIPPGGLERLKLKEPQAIQAFERKKATATQAATSAGAPILFFPTSDYDQTKLDKPGPDFVVLETKPGVASGTSVEVVLDPSLRNSPRDVATGIEQTFTIALDPTFFVDGPRCAAECDPDSYNAIKFRNAVSIDEARKKITLVDVTDPGHEVAIARKDNENDVESESNQYTFDDLGFKFEPAHRYMVRVDPSLKATDGQTLDYTWMGAIDNWHRFAFISFGDGQGVWESSGGPILPFHSRNFRTVQQWLAPLTVDKLLPALQQMRASNFRSAPNAQPQMRTLTPSADKIQSFGLDMKPIIGAGNQGLVWAAMEPKEPIAKAHVYDTDIRSTIVQVTNLGITVKDSPQNVLVYVTTLDTAKPVAGANVSIRNRENAVVWTGVTDERGLATADVKDLRLVKNKKPKKDEDEWEASWAAMDGLHFVVVAEKDGDLAYVSSDWNEGIQPWEFETRFDISEAHPLLRGTIFTDRGGYKLGEEIHFKTIVRSDTPSGMQLLPAATKIDITLTDSHAKQIDKRTLTLGEWSSAEWTFKLPADAPLGTYTVSAKAGGQRLAITDEFLVAAYRRPDFRVDTTLGAPTSLAGTQLDGRITAHYLHGGVMAGRDVTWTYSKRALFDAPAKITDRFPEEQFVFLSDGFEEDRSPDRVQISTADAKLDAKGELALKLDTDEKAGWPFEYQLEGDVTDVTRQHIAGRAAFRVDPAPWYIGVKKASYFFDATKGFDTEIVAAALDGTATPGVDVKLALTRINYNSVRRATGNGF